MEQIYIIGDVHGCYKTLLALIEQFPNKQNSKIAFVGDIIDKGRNSCEVVEFIMNNKYDCVLGNHEQLFLEYAPKKDEFGKDFSMENIPYYFEECGGKATVESYKNSKEIYCKHYDYIQNLPIYLEYQDYKTADDRYLVVSHSAVAKTWCLRNSTEQYQVDDFINMALWNRWKQYDNYDIFNVYGHTVRSDFKMTEFDCNIDLGCVYRHEKVPNPRLCALEFPSMKIYTQRSLE